LSVVVGGFGKENMGLMIGPVAWGKLATARAEQAPPQTRPTKIPSRATEESEDEAMDVLLTAWISVADDGTAPD